MEEDASTEEVLGALADSWSVFWKLLQQLQNLVELIVTRLPTALMKPKTDLTGDNGER